MQSIFPNSFFYYTAIQAQNILQNYTNTKIEWLETIHSTNDYLKEKIKSNKVDFNNNESFTVLTWEQTKGRGQFNRIWKSQFKQCLMLSFAMPLNDYLNTSINNNLNKYMLDKANISTTYIPSGLSLVSGISVHQALGILLCSHDIKNEINIKWPNDIIMQHKKLGGLLTEIITVNRVNYIIVGLGLNLKLNNQDNDNDLQNAISLDKYIQNNSENELFKFISDILLFLKKNISECCLYGFEYFMTAWNNCVYKPNKLQFFSQSQDKKMQGYYNHIDNHGNLYIKTIDDEIIKV